MITSYDPALVGLSVLIAIFAAYAALDLAGRVVVARSSLRPVWIAAGSLAMGLGVWSAHQVGMLALRLPVPVVYDIPLLALSLAISIAASALAFCLVARSSASASVRVLLVGSLSMGGAIAGMHYLGMAALRFPGQVAHHPVPVALSVMIAIGASYLALRLISGFRHGDDAGRELLRKAGGGVTLGLAIVGMHYTAMSAARFTLLPGAAPTEDSVLLPDHLIDAIGVSTLLILALGVLGSSVDRWVKGYRSEILESIADAFFAVDDKWRLTYVNREAERLLGRSPGELLGRNLWDEYPALAGTRFEHEYRRAGRKGQTAHFEAFYPPHGRWYAVRAYPSRQGLSVYFRDVTEQRLAREALLGHAKILDLAHDTIMVRDMDGTIRSWNYGAEQLYGWTREEAVGQNSHALLRTEFPIPIAALEADLLRTTRWEGELVHRGRGGRRIVVASRFTLQHDEHGEFNTVLEINHDITDRKRAEAELHRSHARVQLLLDVTAAANEAKSVAEVLEVGLARVCEFTGWPLGHVYLRASGGQMVPTKIWYPAEPVQYETFRHVTEASYFEPGEGLPGRVLVSGKAVWVPNVTEDANFPRAKMAAEIGVRTGLAFPVLTGTDIVAVLEFFSDEVLEPDEALLEIMALVGVQLGRVFERERASQEIQRSEEQFRLLFEQSPLPMWVIGLETLGFLDVNEAAVRHYGYTRDEFLAMTVKDIRPAEDIPVVVEALATANEAAVHHGEYRHRKKDGTLIDVDVSTQKVSLHGRSVRLSMLRDITERKREEEEHAHLLVLEQEARQKAEDAVQTRDEVLAMVSHDLKNPLQVILLTSSVLADVPLSDERRADYLARISRTAEHMNRLVQGLLDLKRTESGHGIPVEPGSIPVMRLLADGCALFEPQAEAKKIEIVREASETAPSVYADSERILQVLWNLSGNAIKFTPEGGRVTLSAEESGEEILFRVADTGPGVPEEHLERLFDPFWQEKRTARLGTGLGLPITKAIIEAHGGRIWVESEVGVGTTFFFTLPQAGNMASVQ